MSQQPSGLRFDIYERVHLPEHVPAIGDLEEIELVPEIRVSSDGAQTLLTGHLRLSGSYVGKDGADKSQQLEHLIPVEISLPAHRSQRKETIHTEIDNFDVDVISDRSLNVTGVLTLHGITLDASPDGSAWQGEEEEVVFVHRTKESGQPDASGTAEGRERDAAMREQREAAGAEPAGSGAMRGDPADESADAEAEARQAEPASGVEPEAFREEAEEEPREAADEEPVEEEEAAQAAAEVGPGQADEDETAKELKIAFAGKRFPEAEGDRSGLQSLAAGAHQGPASEETAPDDGPQEAPARVGKSPRGSTGDALEWKSLFLSGEEQDRFSKMLMCIVQKEETIQSIAERYGLNPRELVLCNRLGEQDVSEGQVLYIPR